jgi:hypothetical protein
LLSLRKSVFISKHLQIRRRRGEQGRRFPEEEGGEERQKEK